MFALVHGDEVYNLEASSLLFVKVFFVLLHYLFDEINDNDDD